MLWLVVTAFIDWRRHPDVVLVLFIEAIFEFIIRLVRAQWIIRVDIRVGAKLVDQIADLHAEEFELALVAICTLAKNTLILTAGFAG
jgi:hypothetical protein